MDKLKKVANFYNRIEEIFIGGMIAFSVIMLFINVILRYVFNTGIHGADEIALICFVWMSWMGISIVELKRGHVRIDMLSQSLHGTTKKVVDILADIVTLAILAFLVIYGLKVCSLFVEKGTVTNIWKVHKYWIYLSVPLGSFMMGIRVIFHILEVIKTKNYGMVVSEDSEKQVETEV